MGEIPEGFFCFKEAAMTKEQEKIYEDTEVLRKIICDLKGKKFCLDWAPRDVWPLFGQRHHHSEWEEAENHLYAVLLLRR